MPVALHFDLFRRNYLPWRSFSAALRAWYESLACESLCKSWALADYCLSFLLEAVLDHVLAGIPSFELCDWRLVKLFSLSA